LTSAIARRWISQRVMYQPSVPSSVITMNNVRKENRGRNERGDGGMAGSFKAYGKRADAGGVSAISRWSSVAIPPVGNRTNPPIPKGSQHLRLFEVLRVAFIFALANRSFREQRALRDSSLHIRIGNAG
jgi:hypothetical protein